MLRGLEERTEEGRNVSVVIVVKVSEGLVLGADSASTLHGTMRDPAGNQQSGILKTFRNARKLLQIGDFPIGVLTWGHAFIGQRTVESLIREWEHGANWRSIESYRDKGSTYQVKECAEKLSRHLFKAYDHEFKEVATDDRPPLGVLVAGYSEGKFFPEIWRFIFPNDGTGEVHNQRPDVDGRPDFGASWFGVHDAIVRLHYGRDNFGLQLIADKFEIDPKELHELLLPLQYVVPFAHMPLQDAIEYANYMLNVEIGRFRFTLGPELCGGEVELAAITENQSFEWINRKTWKL